MASVLVADICPGLTLVMVLSKPGAPTLTTPLPLPAKTYWTPLIVVPIGGVIKASTIDPLPKATEFMA